MVNKGFKMGTRIVAAIGLMVCLSSGLATAAEVHRFANGIRATIYTPTEITDHWITEGKSSTYLTHPSSGRVELSDHSQTMYPFVIDDVVSALAAMSGFVTQVDVEVFILPAIPKNSGGSFARRGVIYLAPGTGPVDPSTQAYITTHEMGHVLTWVFLDNQPVRWKAYLDMRGLEPSSLDSNVIHADRAREILAEDIRALFGGPLATVSGSIENHDLVHPKWVQGLKDMLAEFFEGRVLVPVQVTSTAFPNPCNPRTTIEMALPEGQYLEDQSATLKIFDIRGAAVKTVTGGYVSNHRLTIQWDGTNRSGEVVSSGRYLYVLEIEDLVSKGAVTLVR